MSVSSEAALWLSLHRERIKWGGVIKGILTDIRSRNRLSNDLTVSRYFKSENFNLLKQR